MKRYDDGIKGYAEMHRHYIEISGLGIRHLTTKILNPDRAKSDEEVLRCVEIWEDQYKEAIKQGMTPLEDIFKISVLEDITTEKMKDKI